MFPNISFALLCKGALRPRMIFQRDLIMIFKIDLQLYVFNIHWLSLALVSMS